MNSESKGVTGGVSGMTGAFKSFGTVAKFAAVGAAIGIGAIVVAAATLTRAVGSVLVGAFKIATATVRALWNVGVAAFNGIASAASTAVGWVTKIGTVVAGSLVGGLLIGIKRSAELQEKWKAMGGVVPVMYQVNGAFASLKDTFINGLAVMADSFLASSGLVGGLYQLRDLIIQNGGLFQQVGTWLGEGFVWAKDKVVGIIGYIQENLPTITAFATTAVGVIVQGLTWAYNAAITVGRIIIQYWGDIKSVVMGVWQAIPGVIATAMDWAHKFLLGVIAVKDTISSPEFWSGIAVAIGKSFGDAYQLGGDFVDKFFMWIGRKIEHFVLTAARHIDNLISKIPGIETTIVEDSVKKGIEPVKDAGMLGIKGLKMARTGLVGAWAHGAEGLGFTNLSAGLAASASGTKISPVGSIFSEKFAATNNKYPDMMSFFPQGMMQKVAPPDPWQSQANADAIAAKQMRMSGGKHSSFGGQTLVNQVNYQPGANNIAFYQRLQGLSGGVI